MGLVGTKLLGTRTSIMPQGWPHPSPPVSPSKPLTTPTPTYPTTLCCSVPYSAYPACILSVIGHVCAWYGGDSTVHPVYQCKSGVRYGVLVIMVGYLGIFRPFKNLSVISDHTIGISNTSAGLSTDLI